MKRILLVWEEVPESIKTFLFDADEKMMEWLPLCHRQFINTEHNAQVEDALLKLNLLLDTLKPVDDAKPFQLGPCLVVLSGFVL